MDCSTTKKTKPPSGRRRAVSEELSEMVQDAIDLLRSMVEPLMDGRPDEIEATGAEVAIAAQNLEAAWNRRAGEGACEHVFEVNYGMYDSMHPYCTKCGRAQ